MEKTLLKEIKNFSDFHFVCNYFGIEINNNQLDGFKKYHKLLLEWNQKINLVSRKSIDNVLEKHFLDSIVFLPEILSNLQFPISNLQSPISVLDIGSGGGFPAILLAIMKPDWKFTLCESIKKKADFLNVVIKELGFEKRINVINARVESEVLQPRIQQFDLITARAIAKLDLLIKYSLPLLKRGSTLIAYKSKNIEDEINVAGKLIEKNNLKLNIYSKEINGVTRKLVVLSNSGIF